jgi:RNA polymerase sigma factor (sigma-70 family)
MQRSSITFVLSSEVSNLETNIKDIHQEVIEQCRAGDRKAQFRLYELYYKGMYNVSLRLVGNENDAEDIMQEAFLSAFGKIGTYRGDSSFGAWLKKIVINRSLDHLKKRKVSFVPVNERTMDQADETWEMSVVKPEAIRKAIGQLPDGYRTVLSLYIFEGYDHEKISRELGISNSASRTQFLRAKIRLKEILKKNEEIFTEL